jgi:hypothetical protein
VKQVYALPQLAVARDTVANQPARDGADDGTGGTIGTAIIAMLPGMAVDLMPDDRSGSAADDRSRGSAVTIVVVIVAVIGAVIGLGIVAVRHRISAAVVRIAIISAPVRGVAVRRVAVGTRVTPAVRGPDVDAETATPMAAMPVPAAMIATVAVPAAAVAMAVAVAAGLAD